MEQGKKASISWWLLSNLPYNGGLYKDIDVDPLELFVKDVDLNIFEFPSSSLR